MGVVVEKVGLQIIGIYTCVNGAVNARPFLFLKKKKTKVLIAL